MYTYNWPLSILINNRALMPSEFKMNAILDFARFLSSGCFAGDLGLILGGFAVVVCVWGVLYGVLWGWGGFVRGVLSRGVLSIGGFCPAGYCPGGFVQGGFVLESVIQKKFWDCLPEILPETIITFTYLLVVVWSFIKVLGNTGWTAVERSGLVWEKDYYHNL